MSRPVGYQPEALGLQAVGPKGTDHVGQPLRPVAQGKAASVFHQPSGRGAQLLQRTEFLAPGGSAACSTPQGKVGWIGHHQIKAPARQRRGAQVAAEHLPLQSVGAEIFPGGSGGQEIHLHPGEGQPLPPPGQQQKQRPAPRPQVTHAPPGLYRAEFPQRQRVAPQGEHPLRPGQRVRAKPLLFDHREALPSRDFKKRIPHFSQLCYNILGINKER